MRKIIKKSIQKVGKKPGTFHYTGEHSHQTTLSLLAYSAEKITAQEHGTNIDAHNLLESELCSWLRVNGLSTVEIFQTLAERFEIHPLLMEDVLHVNQRPKADIIDRGVFITLQLLSFQNNAIESEQVSFIASDEYVVSFHESDSDVFAPIESRLQDATTRLRREKSWYLLFSLLDFVMDQYLVVLEEVEQYLYSMNQRILNEDDYDALPDLYTIKSELLLFRKLTQPVVDIPTKLLAGLSQIDERQAIYFQDLRDHALQVSDISKSYLDMAESLHNLYFSLVGIRTNQTMQTLTVITLIFMPLTLLTGIYGMNFLHMPELEWFFGYPLLLLLMVVITGGVLWVFKRKNWY